MIEKKRINAIIQARMGSSRLPGKIMMPLEGRPILLHIIDRLKAVSRIDHIVVATTINKEDDQISNYCEAVGVPCFRGAELDVLDRFYQASIKYPADFYIRATADDPMIDIGFVDELISFFAEEKLDYAACENIPIGTGVEIFSNNALIEAKKNALEEYEHEHVTPYMYQKMTNYGRISMGINTEVRLTIDTNGDYILAEHIFSALYAGNTVFGARDILDFLGRNPELVRINMHVHQKALGE